MASDFSSITIFFARLTATFRRWTESWSASSRATLLAAVHFFSKSFFCEDRSCKEPSSPVILSRFSIKASRLGPCARNKLLIAANLSSTYSSLSGSDSSLETAPSNSRERSSSWRRLVSIAELISLKSSSKETRFAIREFTCPRVSTTAPS